VKIKLDCSICGDEVEEETELDFISAELSDDLDFVLRCKHGHVEQIILATPKFRVLFESAAAALLAGHPREAVSGFIVALERFYEYWMRIEMEHLGQTEAFDAIWKTMAHQSERQFGAFVTLYVARRGKVPPMLPTNQIEFRNRVIHKGYIPSAAHVRQFAAAVSAVMVPLVEEMKADRGDQMHGLQVREIRKAEYLGEFSRLEDAATRDKPQIHMAHATGRQACARTFEKAAPSSTAP
jgi:hypothetical protein